MVIKWKKQLDKLNLSLKIDLEWIILDIFNRDFDKYDKKKLSWFKDYYRIRIWKYRIVFEDISNKEIKIISIDKRWDIYKNL